MNIHRHIGEIFGWFCAILIVWHVFTPDNPDHVVNLVMHSLLASTFFASSRMNMVVCRYVQPFALLSGMAVTAFYGNFPVSALIAFLAVLIYYAYGGFRPLSRAKIFFTFSLLFSLYFGAMIVSGYDISNAYGTSILWSSGVFGTFWVLWLIMQYFASDLVQQNRDLLELAKKKSKGDCADVATKRG